MVDREKVIGRLDACLEGLCEACSYRDVDAPGGCKDALMYDAFALLKAQEPVEPVFERQFMSCINIYDCGKCGTSLGAKGIAKYCMACGQAVKWE